MTDYLNNPDVVMGDQYLKDAKWYKDPVFNSLGRFEYPVKFNRQTKVQLNKIIALAASIRKGIRKEYPDATKSQLKSLYVTPFWFTGLVEMNNEQWEDWNAGDKTIAEEIKTQIDAAEFRLNEDRRDWFGFGPISGTDVNYSAEWIPSFHLRATADSSIGDPADMNGKAGGTAGTQLDLTSVVLWSASTNATVDFTQALLSNIMTAFENFKDSNTGRRMVEVDAKGMISSYTLYVDLPVIRKFKETHPYDGERYLLNENIYDLITGMGVEIVPYVGLGYSFAEDGEINFILAANVKNNFKAGICKALTWSPWTPTKLGLKPDYERGMDVRYLNVRTPYYDGTNFFKASVYGKFTYKNDSA